jgi:cupin 2 domain-containing protein
MLVENLFHHIPREPPAELFTDLLRTDHFHVERIVSAGHASPAGGWYDQAGQEWVLVLAGAARLEFADGASVELGAGDYLNIPAHRKHRVAWTDPSRPTVWLAIHYPAATASAIEAQP